MAGPPGFFEVMALRQFSLVVGILIASCALPRSVESSTLRSWEPSVVIESFACSRAYAVGTTLITMAGSVRNHGIARSAANSIRLRMRVLAGLEYVSGDTAPWVPELDPEGAATFKWQIQPSMETGPLIVSLSMDAPGELPQIRVIAIPHLKASPSSESASVEKIAIARTNESQSVLENNKVRARIVSADSSIPLMLLSAHTAGGWRRAATCLPLAEVFSGEGGQRPWWEVFKSDEFTALQGKDAATLTISGRVGIRWRATITLKLRTDSSVIDFELQLAPTRQMKLSGVRLCSLLAGDGSFGSVYSEVISAKPSGRNIVSAVRWGEITVGRFESAEMPWRGWEMAPSPDVVGTEYKMLGSEVNAKDNPAIYETGAVIKLRVRLFVITPSSAVADAYKIPPAVETPK
jgi:hypothetical protein